MDLESTIVAVSSAVGAGARAIVRLTGPEAVGLARGICEVGEGAGVERRELGFDGMRVSGWVYRFIAPRSYSGQDLFEFHIPGNPIVVDALVRALVAAGARVAGPGEFTARALLTGKLDLSQAEGVAAVVSAQNRRQLRAARRLAAGELTRRLAPMTEGLARVVTLVEAGIDFADEGIEAISKEEARAAVTGLREDLRTLVEGSERFERIGGMPVIVLVGRPNAGKSALLNALCGRERAVVSSTAGTTRDVLSAEVMLASGVARVVDMAGIEGDEGAVGDENRGWDAGESAMGRIERLMQESARRAAAGADVLVLVRDVMDGRAAIEVGRKVDVVVWTKGDLVDGGGGVARENPVVLARVGGLTPTLTLPLSTGRGDKSESVGGDRSDTGGGDKSESTGSGEGSGTGTGDRCENTGSGEETGTGRGDKPVSAGWKDGNLVSALTGAGMDKLREALDRAAFGEGGGAGADGALALNARHRVAIEAAGVALDRALSRVEAGESEWVAAELRVALDELGSVSGVVSPDDILGRIFVTFCIGK